MAEHRGALQGVAVALGAVVLVSWDPPTGGLVLIDAALVTAAVAVIAALVRAGDAFNPAASPHVHGGAPPAAPGSSPSAQ